MKVAVTMLATSVAALLTLGLVMLYSASMNNPISRGSMELAGAKYLISQMVWCGMGIVACVIAASLDYRLLRKYAWPIFILAVVLLGLVLVPNVGHSAGGARRWFSFGGVSFQPSEFAKIAMLIMLAWYCEHYQRQMHTWTKGIMHPGLLLAVPLGLIFVEPDRGTTILLAAVCGTMMLIAGARWRYILPPIVLGVAGLAYSFWRDPMRSGRIASWLDLEGTKEKFGYQAYQAMIALGSGGWFGRGLGNGRQKLGFVPEDHTDFIFSIIGEELGLVATLAVVIGFLVIIICAVYIATHARDTFGTLLVAGITFLIGFQAFINIGVVTSALPNKGLALPFISYGGSNLLTMLGCIGLVFSVARQGRAPEAKSVNPFTAGEFPATQSV